MPRNAIAEEITGGLPRLMPGTVTGVELRSPPAWLFQKKKERKSGEEKKKGGVVFPDTPPLMGHDMGGKKSHASVLRLNDQQTRP